MNSQNQNRWVFVLAIMFCVMMAYFPSLENQFTNWDDDVYVTQNYDIRALNLGSVLKLFFSYTEGSYHPLASLSFAVEYHSFDLNPWIYHFDNLLIHILNTILVFWLIILLSKNILGGVAVALLFGIHPLHVESVAWVTERKDLLYGLFYLGGLIAYVRYVAHQRQMKYYYFALVLFVFSLLSKLSAITFPLIIVLIDTYYDRKLDRRVILKKLPFFLLSIVFGIIALNGAAQAEALQGNVIYSFVDRLLMANYTLYVYLLKIFVPVKLSALYPLPNINNGMFRMMCSLLMMSSFCLMTLFVWGWSKYKNIVFGIFFYLLTVSITLQIVNVGDAYQADRFMYLPSIGIFWALFYILKKFSKSKKVVVIFILILGVFSFVTYQRCKVWKNSFTLWSDVIEKYPQMYLPYNNRGMALVENQQYDQAILDFDKAIDRKDDYVEAYNNRGILYANKGAISFALMDFNQSIKLRPTVSAFTNRANILRDQGNLDQALDDYQRALSLDSNSKEVYNNRGVLFYKQGNYPKAIADFNKALQIDPQYPSALNNQKALLNQ